MSAGVFSSTTTEEISFRSASCARSTRVSAPSAVKAVGKEAALSYHSLSTLLYSSSIDVERPNIETDTLTSPFAGVTSSTTPS